VEIAKFLVANRRTFKEYAETGRNDAQLVEEFARLCRNEQRLRALFAFTCADRAEWESDRSEPVRWWNIRELYAKALETFRPKQDRAGTLKAAWLRGGRTHHPARLRRGFLQRSLSFARHPYELRLRKLMRN
jgi:hypothetical protein